LGLILLLPRIAPWFLGRYGNRVIEPEIKLVFLSLLALMVLADASNGHAGPARVRARAHDEPALRGAPRGEDPVARRRLLVLDLVLLPQGWAQRLA